MNLYLDVSCLNRPFDDQTQGRIRIETAAITLILERIDARLWEQVSSEMAVLEIDAIRDVAEKRDSPDTGCRARKSALPRRPRLDETTQGPGEDTRSLNRSSRVARVGVTH